jgi:F0F1-type ATP synthase membrane subunit c/vacuolar-type H+-ATPase subunit K
MSNLFKYSWVWLAGVLFPWVSYAQEGAATTAALPSWGVPAAALGLAIAVFGAASAQGRIAAAYMEGSSRNPSAEKVMKTPLILSLVFVETLVIFTLGIVALIVTK